MKFIFYIPILLVQVLSLHRSSTNTLQSVQSSKWPLNLNENTRTVSKLESCVSQECRSFDEVKDLAACKASKLAKLIPHPIKYAYNEYKGKAQNEYTKFVYIIDAESEENGAISGGLRYMR